MSNENVHVVPRGFLWGVLSEHASKPSRLFSNKWVAADYALQSAKKRHSCVVAHDRTGAFKTFECVK